MSKSKSNLTLIAWLLVLALLAFNVFQWYKNNQLSSSLDTKEKNFTELQKVQTELEQSFQTSLTDLEEARGENQELNELIDSQKSELRKQKEKINNLIWTKRELGKAKEELDLMKSQAAGYLAKIRELTENNDMLTASNLKLSNENEVLNEDIKMAKAEISDLDSARVVLTGLKEELDTENEMLAGKVDIAEAIKINSIVVEGFQEKGEKLRTQSKAKKVDLLRTCIKTETNMVAPIGEETFFVRMVTPQGETLAIEEGGSGVLTNKLTNEEVRYSTSGTVEYNQKDTDLCIDWKPNLNLVPGNYNVEVYNKDYMVGKGMFRLK